MEKEIVLYQEKKDCCACGACMNACPKGAIQMQEDSCGFWYPVINQEKCIKCGLCKKVCTFQNYEESNTPIETFAAISANRTQARKSASGGVFAAIAAKCIKDGGVVFGAAFDEDWRVKHISVQILDELTRLQGSKYVHSWIGDSYRQAERMLKEGQKVVFSGTPCQIAGLKGYLGKEYENLLTVDLICHGVPSQKMFLDYLRTLGSEEKKIEKFTFRDKDIGWGINGSAQVSGKRVTIWQSASSYLYYFIRGWLYRENCYHCKYACKNRPADITCGDFWGIEHEHPEYLGKQGWDERQGISVVIANSAKGLDVLHDTTDLVLKESTFEKAAKDNHQLKAPVSEGKRSEVLSVYEQQGWEGLEKRYNQKVGICKHSSQLKALLPIGVKRWLKGKLKRG